MYGDDLVLRDMSEEELRAMVGDFVDMRRRGDMKVNADKSNVIVLNGEEGLECKVLVNGMQ